MANITDTLNDAQRDAVVNYDKPSLIVAGAGSGKTRVLTSRIAYMIEQGVKPGSILALTFTNKAAAEMRERIKHMVGEQRSRYIWMGTFHSIFYRILRQEAEKIGFNSNFTIYDTGNSDSLINAIVKQFNLSTDEYKARDIRSRISLAKNNLVTAEAYAANTSLIAEDRQRKKPEFANIYMEYARRCRANNAMDFDDLLIYTNILFRDHPDTLAMYQDKFRYVLVDEYQDTNYAQYLIVRRLAQRSGNICVVGDDAQSIYSFRGAKIENILQFRNDFPQAQVYKLEQNYRSTRNIVDAANSVIAKNRNKIDKTVFSEKNQGDKIRVVKAFTDQEEALVIADMIKDTGRENDSKWSEIAVLYRNNAQSRTIEEALRRRNVPYIIYKGHSFYERKEIKDLVSYYRLIVNPSDDEAFKRVINTPARGIGSVTVARLADFAAQQGISMWDAAANLDPAHPELKSAVKRIGEFTDMIRGFSLERNEKNLYDFGHDVAVKTGIIGSYKMNPSPESDSALENIGELLNSMQNFKEQRIILAYEEGEEDFDGEPTIEEWLQNISLMSDSDQTSEEMQNRVVLMTVHSAKGLEFDNVFIMGVEENLFPSQMSNESPDKLEEERRLFYVALTRAREKAVISFATSRFKWGSTEFTRPSRFITEIDTRFVDLPDDMEEELADGEDHDPLAELRRRFNVRNQQKTGGSAQNGAKYSKGSTHGGYGQKNAEPGKPKIEVVKPTAPSVTSGKFRSVGSRRDDAPVNKAETQPQDNAAANPVGGFAPGMTVEHAKFGRGKIISVENMVSDIKIIVSFADETVGQKSLLSKYAKLKIIG